MPRIPSSKAGSLLSIATFAAMSGLLHAQGTPNAAQTVPSLPLSAFQDSLGVNTHIEYTDSKYADANAVLTDLQFIGIHNLRAGIPNPTQWFPAGQGLNAMHLMAANGMRFNFVGDCNYDLNTQLQQLDLFVGAYPGSAISVEGANEINNFPCRNGSSNEAAGEAFQRGLYSGVHGSSLLQGVPVLYMTGAAPVNLSTDGGMADVANTHPYPYRGVQPFARLASDFPSYFTSMPASFPKAITETGYATLPNPNDLDGVDEPAQAEMILNIYFDAALEGVAHTYVYQLLDPYADPQANNGDSHLGFFHLDNSPKIIAYALRHLADVFPPDAASPAKTVTASITGLPNGTGHTLALTASDGSVALFMWNEAQVWNPAQQALIFVPPVPVSVAMAGSWNVSYFTPAVDTTFPVSQTNGSYQTYVSSYPTALIFKRK